MKNRESKPVLLIGRNTDDKDLMVDAAFIGKEREFFGVKISRQSEKWELGIVNSCRHKMNISVPPNCGVLFLR